MQIGNTAGASPERRPTRPMQPPRLPAPATSRSPTEDSRKPLDALTPSDRSFVKAVTGVDLQPGRPLPSLANEIALDRQRGVLAEGHRIDIAYLEHLRQRQSSRGRRPAEPVLTQQQLTAVLTYLGRHNGRAPVDFYA